uniref:Putative exostosin-like protein n=1 Tax=Tanacetum cinerariifolium TaxID=118510 RepID=A0A6L2K464_TANCI|nr:putative exostosin-like protein [Tanacetum cinerariifolium]
MTKQTQAFRSSRIRLLRDACLDSLGEHAVHCKELPGLKYRHNMVRDVLFDICRRTGISVKKETPVNFLTDPLDERSTFRPADVLVFGWVGRKHACVDLTEVSPLVGLSGGGFTVGQAALKAASCKVTKHEKTCIKNQHVFIHFAFDTFGFLSPEAVELLTRVQHVMSNNVITPRSINVVFTRIGFAIQKGLAAQLVVRLPSLINRAGKYCKLHGKPSALSFRGSVKYMQTVCRISAPGTTLEGVANPPSVSLKDRKVVPDSDPPSTKYVHLLYELFDKSPNGAYTTGFKLITQQFTRSSHARRRYWVRRYVGWRKFNEAKPSPAHSALASLEKANRISFMITQNVDSGQQLLKQRPGGDIEIDEKFWEEDFHIPTCSKCNGVLKPDGRLKIIRIGVHYGCGSNKMVSAFCEARGNCITSLAMLLQREVPLGLMIWRVPEQTKSTLNNNRSNMAPGQKKDPQSLQFCSLDVEIVKAIKKHTGCVLIDRAIQDILQAERIDLSRILSHLPETTMFNSYFLKLLIAEKIPKLLPRPVNSLKSLNFIRFNFGDSDQLQGALCLLRNSPNLKKLRIINVRFGASTQGFGCGASFKLFGILGLPGPNIESVGDCGNK